MNKYSSWKICWCPSLYYTLTRVTSVFVVAHLTQSDGNRTGYFQTLHLNKNTTVILQEQQIFLVEIIQLFKSNKFLWKLSIFIKATIQTNIMQRNCQRRIECAVMFTWCLACRTPSLSLSTSGAVNSCRRSISLTDTAWSMPSCIPRSSLFSSMTSW